MFYNSRLDIFMHRWCLNHPDFCPRAIQTNDEEIAAVQQHSGAFRTALSDVEKFGNPVLGNVKLALSDEEVGARGSSFVGETGGGRSAMYQRMEKVDGDGEGAPLEINGLNGQPDIWGLK
ncbi:unnamed protein product [Protopolystoma xenopodis]|uniref:Uncharacterized protein n=1 Tax=Protopolystoma xenopodis TaxID=117903 RepID=A0A3S5AAN5_9PLAT|nr:unnamed protein product [Protopolystoma xenopodis]